MAKRKTSIQINGRHYDALSGAPLHFEEDGQQIVNLKTDLPRKSIDGMVSGSAAPIKVVKTVKPVTVASPASVATRSPKAHAGRTPAKHALVKRTTSSQTLMRHTVSKPSASFKKQVKVATHTHHLVKPQHAVIPKTSVNGLNHVRASRAANHTISPRISRFATEVNLTAQTIGQEVRQAAKAVDDAIVIPTTFPTEGFRPDIRQVRITAPANATSDIFEQALLRATSHEQPEVEQPVGRLRALRRRMVSFTAGAVAVLALIGGFGFHNQDAIQFRVAARQAGFSATMPGYQVNGYSISNVKAIDGYLHVKYASANGSYTVSEKQTLWNDDMLEQRLSDAQGTNSFTSVQQAGRTVYMYGRNQAAWVHNGVLYQVVGNGVLSSHDFTQIARSM